MGSILERFEVLLFDLDGVITKTAVVHATAWKQLFDEFLRQESAATGEPFQPFRLPQDYLRHVDGRRRYDGVDAFLRSRSIVLPWGSPGDGPDERTVVGLGNRKDRFFLEAVERHGVETFEDAVALLDEARRQRTRTAVVSASENCDAILSRVGLIDRFDARGRPGRREGGPRGGGGRRGRHRPEGAAGSPWGLSDSSDTGGPVADRLRLIRDQRPWMAARPRAHTARDDEPRRHDDRPSGLTPVRCDPQPLEVPP